VPAVARGDRDDEAQVRIDHALLGGEIAALDALREGDLLGGCQERVAPDLGEEEVERVGRARKLARVEGDVAGLGVLLLLVRAVLGEQRLDFGGQGGVDRCSFRSRSGASGFAPVGASTSARSEGGRGRSAQLQPPID
jgi:hypothetical protein